MFRDMPAPMEDQGPQFGSESVVSVIGSKTGINFIKICLQNDVAFVENR